MILISLIYPQFLWIKKVIHAGQGHIFTQLEGTANAGRGHTHYIYTNNNNKYVNTNSYSTTTVDKNNKNISLIKCQQLHHLLELARRRKAHLWADQLADEKEGKFEAAKQKTHRLQRLYRLIEKLNDKIETLSKEVSL